MKDVLYDYLRDTIYLFGFCGAFIDYTPFFSYTILALIILGFLLINNSEFRYKLISGYIFGIIIKNGFLLSYLLGALSLFLAYLANWILSYTSFFTARLSEPLESQICMVHNPTFTYYKTFNILTNIDYKNLLIKLGILLIRLYATYAIIGFVPYKDMLFLNLIFFIGLNAVQNIEIKENNLNFIRKNLQLFIIHLFIISFLLIIGFFVKNLQSNYTEFINPEILLVYLAYFDYFALLGVLGVCSFLFYYFITSITVVYLRDLYFLIFIEMLLNCLIVAYVAKIQGFNGLLAFASARTMSVFASARAEAIIYPFTYALIYIIGYNFTPFVLALFLLKELKFIELITALTYIIISIIYLNYSLIALTCLLIIGLFYKYASFCEINIK